MRTDSRALELILMEFLEARTRASVSTTHDGHDDDQSHHHHHHHHHRHLPPIPTIAGQKAISRSFAWPSGAPASRAHSMNHAGSDQRIDQMRSEREPTSASGACIHEVRVSRMSARRGRATILQDSRLRLYSRLCMKGVSETRMASAIEDSK